MTKDRSRRRRIALAAALGAGALAGIAPPALAQAPRPAAAAWHDDSPHHVRFVNTARDVDLEVLDWGGTGPALIFLAGYGNTAHVWDGFAPRFTHGFHVIGITRRGFGASSRPADGYDSETLAEDILGVMDALRIDHANFVAHAFGGSELNWLAVHAGRRMSKLVYLDAAYDYAQLFAAPGWLSGPAPRPHAPDSTATAAEWAAWLAQLDGPGYPESELRAAYAVDAAGRPGAALTADSVQQKLMAGTARASYGQIYSLMLAIYAVPRTVRERYPWFDQLTPAEQRDAETRFQVERRVLEHQRARFREEAHNEGIVPIEGGRPYLFLSNEREVEVRIRRFLQPSSSRLQTPPRPNPRLSNWVTW